MKIIEAIAKRAQALMIEKGLTQYALSKKIAISQSCLYNVFCMRQKDIPISRLFLICDGLGVTLQEFFDSELFGKVEIDL